MQPSSADSGAIRFGAFEADLRAGELRKNDRRLKLEGKPFQVLACLLRRPGELVTREELQEELWRSDTFVEFDHGLNTAVNKVRAALGDSARHPVYIETLHRRGYRFIGEILTVAPTPQMAAVNRNPEAPPRAARVAPAAGPVRTFHIAAASALLGVAVGAYIAQGAWQPAQSAIANQEERPAAQIQRLIQARLTQGRKQLVWVDRTGRRLKSVGQPVSDITYPSLSWDERFVAATIAGDVWVQDIALATTTRVSAGAAREALPLWSPAGSALLYSAVSSGGRNIYLRAADGSREARRVQDLAVGEDVIAFDWSRDDQYVVYRDTSRKTRADIGYLQRTGSEAEYQQFSFLRTPFNEGEPKLSPDSRYIAYCSDESGRREIYVSAFPGGEGRVAVSLDGGTQPRWSRDGKEIYYVKRDALMAASVMTGLSISVSPPRLLFRHEGLRSQWPSQQYDVSADGQRFLVVESADPVSAQLKIPGA